MMIIFWELLATTILLILCFCHSLVNYLSIIFGSAIGQTYLEAKMLDLKAKNKRFCKILKSLNYG